MNEFSAALSSNKNGMTKLKTEIIIFRLAPGIIVEIDIFKK
jgi:hypothetical protein